MPEEEVSRDLQLEIVRFGARARVWAFLRLNPGRFFTPEEIAEATRLSPRTVRDSLLFLRRLPRIEVRITYEDGKKTVRYGFKSLIA